MFNGALAVSELHAESAVSELHAESAMTVTQTQLGKCASYI